MPTSTANSLLTDRQTHYKPGLNKIPNLLTGDYDNERNTIIHQKLIIPDLEAATLLPLPYCLMEDNISENPIYIPSVQTIQFKQWQGLS